MRAARASLFEKRAGGHSHSGVYIQGSRSLVAPSPELRERIKAELAGVLASSSGLMAMMLRAQPYRPIGMNDGLIYPGDSYPLGTSALAVSTAALERAPLRGRARVIVVLVEFSDRRFGQSSQHYQDLFFSTGRLPNGSVKEYYSEVSHQMVDIVGEVVGPYTLPKTLAEYAHGASGTGPTLPNARTMAQDAAEAANANVDFSLYDNDGDHYVDAFIVLHAGPGAESTGNPGDIWSHKWVLPGGVYNADGTNIYAYLTVPEDAKIGVCCHELGHLLFGFPDLYDTDYSSEGVGNWCLMGGGSWLGGGEVPAHPSAWCKIQQGWVTVEDVLTRDALPIEDVKTGRKVCRLWKDASPGKEYFLIENRQKMLYDRDLPGSGLLIWHIDEAIPGNTNEMHPKVALVQSDGQRDLENGNNRGDAGDAYPGVSNNLTFTSTSNPSSKAYGGQDSCIIVEHISASGPTMTADMSTRCEPVGLGWWERLLRWLRGLSGRS